MNEIMEEYGSILIGVPFVLIIIGFAFSLIFVGESLGKVLFVLGNMAC